MGQGGALSAHRHAALRPPRRHVRPGPGRTESACRSARSTATCCRWIRTPDCPSGRTAGKYGLESGAFLPPLALTLHEATTLFLAARLLAKVSDEHDTELIGALVKIAQILPPVLAEHIEATVDVFSRTPPNPRFTNVFRVLAEGWAKQRVVEIEYDAGVYDASKGSRKAKVHPSPSSLRH